MGIETDLAQQTIDINNKRYKTKGADWKEWENDITLLLFEGFQERSNLSSKSDIDNYVAKLTSIINKIAEQSLGIAKTSSYAKSWWNKQLTEAYQNYRQMFTYRATKQNHQNSKKVKNICSS